MGLLQTFVHLVKKLYHVLTDEAQDSQYLAVPLGWLGFIGFPAYYYIWHTLYPQPYENLTLRLVGSVLCLGLMLHRYWPQRLLGFFPIYWFLTTLYSLPFFFSFFLLKNDFTTIQLMSSLSALFILIMIFEWTSSLVMYLMGVTFSLIAYYLTTSDPILRMHHTSYLFVFLFAMILGSIFSRRKSEFQKRKLEGMITISTTIAHELRTPLLGIRSGITAIDKYMPTLLEGYDAALKAELPIKKIRRAHYLGLQNVLERTLAETNYSNTIIDILMMNVKQPEIHEESFKKLSMKHCIEDSLKRYPFNSLEEKEKIHVMLEDDFSFFGSEILMVHVIFNLLKNALHFIHKSKKGSVYIRLANDKRWNYLYFEDTGKGISKEEMGRLFKMFYTTTLTGTGIGLAFSKRVIDSFKGTIDVQSTLNEYTLFTIKLPKVQG